MSDDSGELGFLEFLQTFRRGELVAAADRQMEELLAAVRATGGSGEMTIKLPVKVNKAGQLEITPAVAVKVPRAPLGTGIYFVSEDDRLTRRDPAQVDWVDELRARREAKED